MIRKMCILFVTGLLGYLFSYAGTDRSVLLTIGGQSVSVEEFNDCYVRSFSAKNISPKDFFDYFLSYKLKAYEARCLGWDTLPDFRMQCRLLQGKVAERYMLDLQKSEDHRLFCSQRKLSRLQSSCWVKLEHISVFLSQHASASEEQVAREKMDDVCRELKNGVAFAELYAQNPEREHFYSSGEWIPLTALVKEFAERLQSMEVGEVSSPFYSPLGIHVVRLVDRKRGVGLEGALQKVQELEGCQVKNLFFDGIESVLPEMAFRLMQVEDGLLAAYWDEANENVAEVGLLPGMARYFKMNKDRYAWDLPHFKGGIIHCLNKKAASKLKKKLKKVPYELWPDVIEKLSVEDKSLCAKVETGIFRIGANEYVDKLAFKCGTYKPDSLFPYTFVLGKRLTKGPEDYTDVLEKVKNDYLAACEQEKMKELIDKFSVEINQEVLKTVNCDGGK